MKFQVVQTNTVYFLNNIKTHLGTTHTIHSRKFHSFGAIMNQNEVRILIKVIV